MTNVNVRIGPLWKNEIEEWNAAVSSHNTSPQPFKQVESQFVGGECDRKSRVVEDLGAKHE